MKQLHQVKSIALAVVLVIALTPLTHSQSFTGTVSGRVVDQAGATLADAKLSLKNVETGAVINTTADSEGEYIFISVPPGKYSTCS